MIVAGFHSRSIVAKSKVAGKVESRWHSRKASIGRSLFSDKICPNFWKEFFRIKKSPRKSQAIVAWNSRSISFGCVRERRNVLFRDSRSVRVVPERLVRGEDVFLLIFHAEVILRSKYVNNGVYLTFCD